MLPLPDDINAIKLINLVMVCCWIEEMPELKF